MLRSLVDHWQCTRCASPSVEILLAIQLLPEERSERRCYCGTERNGRKVDKSVGRVSTFTALELERREQELAVGMVQMQNPFVAIQQHDEGQNLVELSNL